MVVLVSFVERAVMSLSCIAGKRPCCLLDLGNSFFGPCLACERHGISLAIL